MRVALLLRLYPRWWRARYGAELAAHLRSERLRRREVVDLLGGAVDAWLWPQWPRRRRWRRGAALLVTIASGVVVVAAAALWLRLAGLAGLVLVMLALLLRRRRPPRGWDPGAGAGVPARPPAPDPEPLSAARR